MRLILGLLPLLAATVSAQEPFRIDDAELQRIVDKMVPLVEKYTGRKFDEPPTVLLSDSKEMAEALTDDLFVSFRKLAPKADEDYMRWYAEFSANFMAPGIFGKFGLTNEELYVEPEKVTQTLQVLGHDLALGQPFFELIVAHELVHAMQHQEIDLLQTVDAIDDQDRLHTFNARIEGHALFVHERIARELGFEEAAELFRTLNSLELDGEDAGSQLAFITRSNRQITQTHYLTGAERIAELLAAGGHERIWQEMQSELPPSRSVFLPIDEQDLQPTTDYTGVLEGAEQLFGQRKWVVMRGNLGEAMLRSENCHASDLDSLMRSFRGGEFCECVLRGLTQRGLASALAFADAEAARQFVKSSEESTAVDAGRVRATETHFCAIECPDGMTGRRYEQKPKRMGGALRGNLLWLQQGRYVLQVFSAGFAVEDQDAIALATKVFARMRKR